MRRLGYVSIFCWVMVIIVCICFMFGSFGFSNFIPNFGGGRFHFDIVDGYSDFTSISEDIILNDNVHDINVEWVSGDVKIITHDDSTYKIVSTVANNMAEKEKAHYRLVNGNLDVIFCEPNVNINVDKISKNLTIYVPKNSTFSLVEIESVSSKIVISDIEVTELLVQAVSGNIIIDNVTGNTFEADNVSGSYNIRNSSFVDADVQSISGDFDFDGSLQNISIDTVSGDYKIRTTAIMESLEVDAVSGNVSLTMPDNSGFSTDSGILNNVYSSDFPLAKAGDGEYSYGDGSRYYDLDMASGNFRIYKLSE